MKILGVIPARWASTRFEGKVLAEIKGKPMIQHVWERAKKSQLLDGVLIACDDSRVFHKTKEFGADVVMTSQDHASGTDRITEAVQDLDAEIVINIQGDEPLIDPKVIDDLGRALLDDEACSMATVIKKLDDERAIQDPNVVKVVINQEGFALYFSRSVIPHNRDNKPFETIQYYKHLGLYAYRKQFLLFYKKLPKSQLEITEKLEQLRALESGYKIKTVQTDIDTIGVDTAEDLRKVEEVMADD